ncbi:hypothetical protein V8E54_014546 [Elaphomyces granulatus]
MKRLKSSTRQGCMTVRRGCITKKYASEDDSPSGSVLGKRSHDDNDDGRIFDSDYNEDDFGEAVEGEEPEGYFSDDDQTVHGLARHFQEAGEDGGLPLGLDLEAIQLEDQYQNTEYGPEPIENAIPTTGFNFNEVDDTDMDMEPPSPPMQTMGPPPRPIQMEDESEFIAHMHFHDPNMSQLEMALGIFAGNTGMSRTENGRIPRFQNDRRKLNDHAGLHHERMTEEFGPLGHVGSLIGEDMHRKLKKEVYTTRHSNVEPALLMKENQQLTLRLVNKFDTDISCRTIIHIGDFIEYKDFATRANRIGKVDSIFQQLLETRRLFCRISEAEFTGNGGVIGLPRIGSIGSRNLYVIDIDNTLILVDWIDVHSLQSAQSVASGFSDVLHSMTCLD